MHRIAVEHFQHGDYSFTKEALENGNEGASNGDLSRAFFNGNYMSD